MTLQDFFNLDTNRLSIKPNPATRYLQFYLSEHPLAGQNGVVNFRMPAAAAIAPQSVLELPRVSSWSVRWKCSKWFGRCPRAGYLHHPRDFRERMGQVAAFFGQAALSK